MDSYTIDSDDYQEDYLWEDFKSEIEMALDTLNDNLYFKVVGTNLGWQNRSGEFTGYIAGYEQFVDKVLPNTSDYSLVVKVSKDELNCTCYHHDSPTGEFYKITKAVEQ